MEASPGKKVGENPQNEISHGASTKSYCHQLPQPTVDTGNNHDTDSDQGTELAENFSVHLTMNDLGVEISAGSSEGSGSQPVKEMPTGDPKPVSPRGAGKQDSGVQQVGKAAGHSDYHHSLPLGQDTAPNLLTEDFREAKEVVEKKAGEVKALQKGIEESSTREPEINELIKKLQQMYQWKEDECNRLKEDKENQARQIQALENKVQVLEKKTGQVEALESKIESLEKQSEELKTDNNNLHQNAAFLLKKLREKTEELDVISQYKQEIQKLEQSRAELLESLQAVLRSSDMMNQWKEAECKKLKEKLRKKEEKLNTVYQRMQQEIQNVEQYKEEAQDRLQQLATSFQTMKQRCKKRAAIILEKDVLINRLIWALIYIISYLFTYTPTYAPFDNL